MALAEDSTRSVRPLQLGCSGGAHPRPCPLHRIDRWAGQVTQITEQENSFVLLQLSGVVAIVAVENGHRWVDGPVCLECGQTAEVGGQIEACFEGILRAVFFGCFDERRNEKSQPSQWRVSTYIDIANGNATRHLCGIVRKGVEGIKWLAGWVGWD